MLLSLWHHLSKRRKKQFALILILMFLASIAEIVSVGAVLPFLGVLTSPEKVFLNPLAQPLISFLELTDQSQLLLPITIIFILAALFAGIIRLMLLYAMTRFSYATGADISINIYHRTLHQEYEVHLAQNSSEVINGIINKTNTVIAGAINPVLIIISSIAVLIGVMSVLIVIDIKIAITASVGFGLIYFGVISYTKKQLKENSQTIADKSTQMIKSLQEGLGGIRDVLINGSQEFYSKLYRNADIPFRRASGNNAFISGSPRFAIEAIGMSLIACLAYVTTQQESEMVSAIPVLGAMALGAQRLLPALQQAYSAYTTINGAKASIKDVLKLLEQPVAYRINSNSNSLSSTFDVPFKKEIILDNISFRYSKDTPLVLRDINLKFTKGNRIGFVGITGSGKSTLLDIIMGLLPPTNGSIAVDGQLITEKNRSGWQSHIAHVPQNIFLSDSTIEENIAFGISKEKIDYARVKKAAKQAQILELIEGWKEGFNTFVGERGIRLSGGQRQRIGIARALYKKANVLIFDEATSALDSETEKAVMSGLEDLGSDLTILIIAHRLSTLKGCDQIVRIDNHQATSIENYDDLVVEKN